MLQWIVDIGCPLGIAANIMVVWISVKNSSLGFSTYMASFYPWPEPSLP